MGLPEIDNVREGMTALNVNVNSVLFSLERMRDRLDAFGEKVQALEKQIENLAKMMLVVYAMNEKHEQRLETIEAYTESLVNTNNPPRLAKGEELKQATGQAA